MLQIPPHLLQALTVFHDQKTLELTAKQLLLTQPAVSIQLRQLQDYFDLPLYRVQGRNKVLTRFGQTMAERLKKDLECLKQTQAQVVREFASEEALTLKIGGRNEFMQKLIPPGVFKGSLDYTEMTSSQVIKALEENILDMGLVHHRLENVDYLCKKLSSDELYLLVPKAWKMKVNLKTFFQQAPDLPALTFATYPKIFNELKKVFAVRKPWKIKASISDWNIICKWVDGGHGWSVVPGLFIDHSQHSEKISLKDFPHGIDYYLYLRRELRNFPWYDKLISRIQG